MLPHYKTILTSTIEVSKKSTLKYYPITTNRLHWPLSQLQSNDKKSYSSSLLFSKTFPVISLTNNTSTNEKTDNIGKFNSFLLWNNEPSLKKQWINQFYSTSTTNTSYHIPLTKTITQKLGSSLYENFSNLNLEWNNKNFNNNKIVKKFYHQHQPLQFNSNLINQVVVKTNLNINSYNKNEKMSLLNHIKKASNYDIILERHYSTFSYYNSSTTIQNGNMYFRNTISNLNHFISKDNLNDPIFKRMYIRNTYFEDRNENRNYYGGNNKKRSNKNKNKKKKNFFKNFRLTPKKAIYSILGINTLVFAAWQYAIEQANSYGDFRFYHFMENNFCVSWHNVLRKKRWWTILTSAFSHQEKMHFIMNMLVFNSFAPSVIQAMGPQNFIALYLFSGACSSLSHISFNHYVLPSLNRKNQQTQSLLDLFLGNTPEPQSTYDRISSLGASGAIMGINTIFACLYPRSIIQMGMFLPLPAWLAMSLYTTMDIYRTATMTNGRIDTAGHVGGALSGVAFYLIKIRPQIQKWKNKKMY